MHRIPRYKIKSFAFNQTTDDFLKTLDEITLSKHPELLTTIHNKYPLLSQIELAMVIKTIFETMRELLIRGCILHIDGFFRDFKLYFFQNKKAIRTETAVRVSLSTATPLKDNK